MIVVALDPGIAGCGVALVSDAESTRIHTEHIAASTLIRAEYVRNRARQDNPLADAQSMATMVAAWVWLWVGESPVRLLAEWPRVYRAGRAKVGADPNDLLLLSAVAAAVAAALGCPSESVEPRAWKGTLGENDAGEYLVETRVRERLTTAELARVHLPTAASLAHNVWDVVGIGLHAVRRGIVNARKRVLAR